jgi:alkanesulfonate monooxygenase SsuD/methylene tetrahydromethanopterin reductase-like flavin-dependent oxidoreductase (luciferase family)
VRAARLRECVDVTRALLAGEVVDHDGLVRVDRARMWTLPARPPALIGAAVSPETARWCGGSADGLVTINQPRAALERVIAAFREGGGERKPIRLQVHLSWAPTDEEALRIARDLAGRATEARLPLDAEGVLVDLLGKEDVAAGAQVSLALQPYAHRWFRLRRPGQRVAP